MIADAVKHVGGARVSVTALMGPGVDPHLYKASEGDVARLARADLIFYNGLHLEGKMVEIFEQMKRRKPTFAVADGVDPGRLIHSEKFASSHDPHIWFDVRIWQPVVMYIRDVLARLDPKHAEIYRENAAAYLQELEALDRYVRSRIAEIPPQRRVLITAHDAFEYFGRAYGLEVHGLQGISTASEAGTADVQRLADFIVQRKIPAVFVETSV
ncbi:MAG: manganese transporter, partial [Calditrichaeota bacterium]